MMACMIAVTPRTTLGRKPSRGTHDEAKIHAILDEALICHVGFVDGGQPFVIPTLHVRVGDGLYLHGSQRSRMLGVLRAGATACVTVTVLDALVEHVARGRSRETRAPDEGELQATAVVRIPITEASAKVREGPPVDL